VDIISLLFERTVKEQQEPGAGSAMRLERRLKRLVSEEVRARIERSKVEWLWIEHVLLLP
jgi:hypothetical protein